MNVPFVDLKAQYAFLKPQMDAAIQSVLERSAFILGPEVEAFEQAFAEYIGVKHAVGVGSGTDALRLALEALDIGPGDEVITVANTYTATCEAISHVGATVRLVDVDPRAYNMDVGKLVQTVETFVKRPQTADPSATPRASRRARSGSGRPSAVDSRLKAIIPVHLYGQPADMDPILKIVRRHGLYVVEDCAQSHGARYKGRQTGTFGDVACFSFYPGKTLGAYGDGGAVLTDDDEVAERVRMLRNHGQKVKYEHLIVGYCHRLDNLQAAVLNVKLPHLDEWNVARRSRAALYDELLQDVQGIETPYVLPEVEPVYHLYVIRVADGQRDALQRYLSEAGIATGLHYPIPVHLQQAYVAMGHKPGDFPVSEQLAAQGLSLPMYPEQTDEQVQYVADKIREFMANGR